MAIFLNVVLKEEILKFNGKLKFSTIMKMIDYFCVIS